MDSQPIIYNIYTHTEEIDKERNASEEGGKMKTIWRDRRGLSTGCKIKVWSDLKKEYKFTPKLLFKNHIIMITPK